MRKRFISFLYWLLSQIEQPDPTSARAKELVIWANTAFPNVTGERKRHQVINKLAIEYPDKRLRDLSYVIEKALQEK